MDQALSIPNFHGTSKEECREFIQNVKRVALTSNKHSDDGWMAALASAGMAGQAFEWYTGLDDTVQNSWPLLLKSMLREYITGNGIAQSSNIPTAAFAPASAPLPPAKTPAPTRAPSSTAIGGVVAAAPSLPARVSPLAKAPTPARASNSTAVGGAAVAAPPPLPTRSTAASGPIPAAPSTRTRASARAQPALRASRSTTFGGSISTAQPPPLPRASTSVSGSPPALTQKRVPSSAPRGGFVPPLPAPKSALRTPAPRYPQIPISYSISGTIAVMDLKTDPLKVTSDRWLTGTCDSGGAFLWTTLAEDLGYFRLVDTGKPQSNIYVIDTLGDNACLALTAMSTTAHGKPKHASPHDAVLAAAPPGYDPESRASTWIFEKSYTATEIWSYTSDGTLTATVPFDDARPRSEFAEAPLHSARIYAPVATYYWNKRFQGKYDCKRVKLVFLPWTGWERC